MTENKKGWDLSIVLALVAVLISICTMIISLVETSIMQKQSAAMVETAKASVWPHITVLMNTGMADDLIEYKVVVENKGVGPALVNKMEVFYEGQSVGSSIVDEIMKQCPDAVVTNVLSNNVQNMILSPREVKTILRVSLKDVDFMKFAKFSSNVTTEYCYANIYGDIWVSKDDNPVRSKVCK